MTGDFHMIKTLEKRAWIAHGLNIIFPGVGLIYWRRGERGLFWLGISLGFSVGLISLWMISPFLPQILIASLLAYWAIAQGYLFRCVIEEAPTETLWSRDASLIPFIGLSTLCLSLICFVLYIGMTRVYTFVSVRDMSMYPQLLKGDLVLVDRRSYEDHPFLIGEVIAYDSSVTGVTISRVIAAPESSARVEVSSSGVSLGDRVYHLESVSVEVPHLTDFEGLEDDQKFLVYFLEYPPVSSSQSEGEPWLISMPVDPKRRELSLNGHLGKNTLLVLPDQRSAPSVKLIHRGEIIDRSRVIGRPVLVISSTFTHPAASSRRGLSIK